MMKIYMTRGEIKGVTTIRGATIGTKGGAKTMEETKVETTVRTGTVVKDLITAKRSVQALTAGNMETTAAFTNNSSPSNISNRNTNNPMATIMDTNNRSSSPNSSPTLTCTRTGRTGVSTNS